MSQFSRLILILSFLFTSMAFAIELNTMNSISSENSVTSPDGSIKLTVSIDKKSVIRYQIFKNHQVVLLPSQLGLTLSDRQFHSNIVNITSNAITQVDDEYDLFSGKKNHIRYLANERTFLVSNDKNQQLEIIIRISDDGVAFKYNALASGSTAKQEVSVVKEYTSFHLPPNSRAWLQPIAEAQTGWANTNPSYEEHYLMDIPVEQSSPSPAGWVFPALFRTNSQSTLTKPQDDTWLAITEAGVEVKHHASRLSVTSANGGYQLGLPMPAEVFTGKALLTHGTLPLDTPWRVLALGTLEAIANSTLGTDLAKPAVEMDSEFIKPGLSSWSWGLLKDDATVYPVQREFIDYASDMHWQYTLIDADWDRKIGDKKLAELVDYATSKNVGIWVWYNSSGDWNTTEYSPKNRLLSHKSRTQEFSKLNRIGVKGIKIDFFAGDGQSMMAYYHEILNDAAKYQLLVNFHGATLPRGLHRTYPNLLSAEAVRGFEMITFFQNAADKQPSHSAMLPFTRNLFDPMDFTPTTFNEIPNIKRKTTNGFELALPIIFVSGIQHIVETPDGMKTVPGYVKQFLRQLPVQWDESRYIAGTPGKLAVFARRSGNLWYIAGINGENSAKTVSLDLNFLAGKNAYAIKSAGDRGFSVQNIVLTTTTKVSLAGNDGFVMRVEN